MGTVVNGNVWAGACVDGNIVSGLVKNGVVFYKKDTTPSVLYKRRIMVGDNLKGLQIFLEQYPDNFYDILFESDGEGTTIIVECNNGDSDIEIYNEATYDNSTDELVLVSGEIRNWLLWGGTTNIYDFDLTTDPIEVTVNSPKQVHDNMDYIVTNIDNTSAGYRCLFIEDSNIRPLQVGDIVTENTVFYFAFPDNLYEDETIDWSSSVFDTTGSAGSIYMSMVNFGSDYTIYGYFGSYSMTTIYQYNNGLQSNVSYIVCGNAGTGQVSSINENLSKYILVDTTTLGA